jgi:hypothetical protein
MSAAPPDKDAPITLEKACEYFDNVITPWSLKAEAQRGRLRIFKVGRRQFTTLRDVQELCRAAHSHTSISTSHGTPTVSGMVLDQSELDALLERKLAPKQSLRSTSPANIDRRRRQALASGT